MSNRHRVFISYHHALDESYRKLIELRFGNAFGAIVPGSVDDGDINPNLPTETFQQRIRDEHLRDTSKAVVLFDDQTWQRKHIEWEIDSSIRDTSASSRSGLLDIVLPTYPRMDKSQYNPRTIPFRLHDNIECGFASTHNWWEEAATGQNWVRQAYHRMSSKQPDNSRTSFGKNRTGAAWRD